MFITGQLGRSGFGKFELGKPLSTFRGETVLGSFSCAVKFDPVAFEASHDPAIQNGAFSCDIHTTCAWVPSHSIAGVFSCSFAFTAVFISGDGAVAITCLVNGATIMTNPFAGFLFDAPYSY